MSADQVTKPAPVSDNPISDLRLEQIALGRMLPPRDFRVLARELLAARGALRRVLETAYGAVPDGECYAEGETDLMDTIRSLLPTASGG